MSKSGDFEAVRKDIAKLMHQPEFDDGSAGPILVRLAWYVPFTFSHLRILAWGDCLRIFPALAAN